MLSSISEAIEDIKAGKFIVIVDDESRENEGDLAMADEKVTTGISAFDRAQTIRTVLDCNTKPSDIAQPGHIFPIRAKEGGVLVRAGHSEAIVDLARLAGVYPAGVICGGLGG